MLNKQGPNKIDWTDYTWDPITGCRHDCPYCYMRRMKRHFADVMEPRFRSNYLFDSFKVRKLSKIFVGSSGDMFGEWVPASWIEQVFDVVANTPDIFQFLTKNPERYGDFENLPENAWYGAIVDGTNRTLNNDLLLAQNIPVDLIRFISFEPLLNPIFHVEWDELDWIIIGADSTHGAVKPPNTWATDLIYEAHKRSIPVWIKDNYGYPKRIKEFPIKGQLGLQYQLPTG